MAPSIEIDQLRYNDRALNAIELFDTLGTVPAWGDDEIGAPRILCLQPGVKRHARSREPGFKTHSVGQDAFYAGDVRGRVTLSGNGIAIGIDADCGVCAEISCAQRFIE